MLSKAGCLSMAANVRALCRLFYRLALHLVELDIQIGFRCQTGLAQNPLL